MNGDRERLRQLLRTEAVLHGDFVLTSGARASTYLDARRVTLSAAGAVLVGRLFYDLLQGTEARGVAGLAIGADPIVTAVAFASATRSRPLDAFIIRKERKEHGTGRRIEGPWRPGLAIAVLEDTFTTGGSALEAARAVEEEGGRVTDVFALIDREEGARAAIESAGYSCQALYSARELTD